MITSSPAPISGRTHVQTHGAVCARCSVFCWSCQVDLQRAGALLDAPHSQCYCACLSSYPGLALPVAMSKRGGNLVRRAVLQCVTVMLVVLWTVCCSVVWQVEAASDTFTTPPYGPLRLVNQHP